MEVWEDAFSGVSGRELLLLFLRAEFDYSPRDIADHLDIPYQSIVNLHHKTAERVRRHFGQESPENRKRRRRNQAEADVVTSIEQNGK